MKFKKLLAVGATTILASITLAACGSNAAPKDQANFSSSDIIATMDSSTNTDVIGAQALNNTMEGLYRYKGKEVKPAMATKVVKPTNNGLTYTFPIRKGVKWSNGDPVTANDFVYSWQRTVDPKTKSQYAYIYEGIKNAKDITAGKKPVSSLGAKAVNKYTFQVTLEKPIPYFNQLIMNATFLPQDKKVVQQAGKKYGTSSKYLAFNGPYKMSSWSSPNNSWTMTKNSKYWNAKNVKTNKLNYQVTKDASTSMNLFQSHKLDLAAIGGDTAKQMKKDKHYTTQPQTSTFYFEMNQKKDPYFKNAKLRQAISMSINRKQLVSKVLGSGDIPANSVTPQKMSYDPANKSKDFTQETSQTGNAATKYDPAQAKQLWKQGLAETNMTGKSINITLLGDDTEVAKQQNEFLQSELEKLPGVKVTLNNVPFKSRLSRSVSGDFDMVVSAWNADFPDPINFLSLFETSNAQNDGHWSNPQYDALLEKSMTTDANNPTARWNDMKQAQDILNKEQGVVPLYQVTQAYLKSNRMSGLDYGPSGSYNNVSLKLNNSKK